ncbi:CHRD domain-containing protein [Aquiflexum sp.]|uniref:CHRD domain-containing protein n=1 Tax=Aquiflexum sp. TaxID=1872584 RepID=UPI003593BFF4
MKNYYQSYLCFAIAMMLFACEAFKQENPVKEIIAEENLNDLTAKKKASFTNYGAFLTGTEEVGPVDAMGTGAAFFELVDGGMGIKYQIRVANMEGIVAGHIHTAAFGGNGPVVAFLFPNQPASPLVNGVIAEGTITESQLRGPFLGMTLDVLIDALNDGMAYVNIHTVKFPGGEIRGQISGVQPGNNRNFTTQLSGNEEVPPADTKAVGTGIFKFDSKISALNFQVNVAQLENVRFAHIHIGKKGFNGPPVAFLKADKVEGPVNGVYAKGTICAEDLIGKMLGGDLLILREAFRTGNAYVNVHTDKFPGGELRGQL